MKSLNEIAENYFNTLNPIAERISNDILAIKEAYEGLWSSLSDKERNQIINDTVVHPEALLKYALESKSSEENDELPLYTKVTGSKFVVDENTGNLWRDEHSAPFSWKTPSQINLAIFTTSNEDVLDGSFIINNKNNKTTQEIRSTTVKNFDLLFEKNETWCVSDEKNDAKKSALSPESNVVLVGTCSKLSGLCSKFKFLPSKSYSYEVQTVIANPTVSNDGSFLDKIKSSAVLKLQTTLKLIGGKTGEKKLENKETDNLVQSKGSAAIVRLTKTSPNVSKPKSPPPPPPVFNLPLKNYDNEEKSGNNLVSVNTNSSTHHHQEEPDSEKVTLLHDKSFLSSDLESGEHDSSQSRFAHEVSDDFNTLSTECTPLSGPTTETIPKSGFDFLDNW